MPPRIFILTLAVLALLPVSVAIAGDHSSDYGHHTVGADNNDDAGNVEHDEHPREDFDNKDGAAPAPERRKAEDGRYPIHPTREHQGDVGNE